jgi:hypothetical protein
MEMNLAHAYLFNDEYDNAAKIYKSHLNEPVSQDIKWQDIIQSDFMFFRNNNFNKDPMQRILIDLKLEVSEGFK